MIDSHRNSPSLKFSAEMLSCDLFKQSRIFQFRRTGVWIRRIPNSLRIKGFLLLAPPELPIIQIAPAPESAPAASDASRITNCRNSR
jgi:hypothetical protein